MVLCINHIEKNNRNTHPMFSARDNLSLWVIGPSIGQFIAGIRQVLIMIIMMIVSLNYN